MNRRDRRAAVRRAGATWAQARRLDRDIRAEGRVAGKAAKLSPEEARRALAEWAERGGDPGMQPHGGNIPVVH